MAEGDRIDDEGSRRLIIIMRAAARRARRELINPGGRTAISQGVSEAQAAARLQGIHRALVGMNVEANGIINDRVRRTYAGGIRSAERMMREVGLTPADQPIHGALMGVEIQRAGQLVGRHQADINKAFRSIEGVTGRAIRQARALGINDQKLKHLLAGGAIDGDPKHAVQQVKKLMQKIAINGLVEVPTRNGNVITFKPDVYADLVYQTAMAEASVNGEIDRLAGKGHDLVKIIGSHSVHFCTAFVDKVYSLSGTSSTYPAYRRLPRGGPPFHPRCTKRIIPFNERLATSKQREKALPDEETNRLHDQPPAAAQKQFEATNEPRPPRATTAAPATTSAMPAVANPPVSPSPTPPIQPAPPPLPDRVAVERPPLDAAPTAEAQFRRDRVREVRMRRSVGSFDDVAHDLEVTAETAERLVHASIPGTRQIFPSIDVMRETPGVIKVHAESPDRQSIMTRTLSRDDDGKLVVHADLFDLAKPLQGKGVGSTAFFEMARGLTQLGVDRVETFAARSRYFNGYYTWPRLGYNVELAGLPLAARQALYVAGYALDENDLLDLVATNEGRKVWKGLGTSAEMRFDLNPSSKSWAALLAYLSEKRAR